MKKHKKGSISYTAVFTLAEEGGYTVTVPSLPGCISEGDSFEEAKENIAEAIELYTSIVGRTRPTSSSDFIVAPVTV